MKLQQVVVLLVLALACQADDAKPRGCLAHSHNDYERARPLFEALEHGFESVEADVHLVEGRLLVAHDAPDAKPERTLQALYLEPLRERVRENRGRVHPGRDRPFFLLVDFKTEAEATYEALKKALEPHRDMLTRFGPGKTVPGAVTIIVSGNRPQATMEKETSRLAGFDGRLADLEGQADAHFMPWISDDWRLHFQWRGEGPLSETDRAMLTKIVRQTHERLQLLRFWAIPDTPDAWRIMRDAGVDLINTDRIPELRETLGSPKPLD